ncbi:hypothetical protein [Schumannella luteola]|jgi:hypothetical protein
MIRARVLIGATLSIALLASGCAAQEPSSAPPTFNAPELTASEKAAQTAVVLDEEWRAIQAEFPEAERPDATLDRYVWPAEWSSMQAECLQAQGFEASVDTDGALVMKGTDSQRLPALLASFVCKVQYPVDPVAEIPLNDSQIEYVYWYYTNTLTQCLEDLGIDVAPAPSLVVFKETFYSDGFWSPYASVPEDFDWARATDSCPQSPDGIYGGDS